MLITIEPTLIVSDKQIFRLASLSKDNAFAAIVGGEFVEVEFQKESKLKISAIVKHFPNEIGDMLYSDPANNVLWITSGRGISVLDITTKKTAEKILSGYGNDNLVSGSYLIAYDKKLLYVDITHLDSFFGGSRPGDNFILFDYVNDSIDFASKGFNGGLLAISKDRYLFKESIKNENGKSYLWQITDKDFSIHEQNKLTKKLNEVKISIEYFQSKSYNFEKRMMFGWKKINEDTIRDFVVRWKPGFEDVTVEPIIAQAPDGYDFGTHYYFSPSGEWIKTTGSPNANYKEKHVVFFHISDKYPQGLSFGIVGGFTGDDMRDNGCFVNHKEWGTLYVDRDPDKLNILRVYKLNDALKAIQKATK